MNKLTIFTTLICLFNLSYSINAAESEDSLKVSNWQNEDPKVDKSWGISTERAYTDLLQNKKSQPVIVAVIDNGVDINHEDLKDRIWINTDEIPGNGIDDDNNGYIDDIHGWNFIGNSDGKNIDAANLEVTRLYRKYYSLYGETSMDSVRLINPGDYKVYKKVKNTYLKELTQLEQEKAFFDGVTSTYFRYDSLLANRLSNPNYTLNDLKKLKVEKKTEIDTARRYMILLVSNNITKSTINDANEYFNSRLNYHFNVDFNSRDIIGDDEWVWESAYGNNDVAGTNPDHGTSVSGLIAANRNNNIGIKGVADNVKIMCIRTVPDGDEWDKDVANAIKYAIDNGASIINMSFGKAFSPQQEFIINVLKQSVDKDVLFVHAAGNDSENNDNVYNYPRKYDTDNNVITENWITVGASSIKKSKKDFVAGFSNYGKKTVDIFAPGENILSCTPNNGYDFAGGTSFAAPMVAGAAALIKSYYPNLTSAEIKQILLESSSTKNINVALPGTNGKNIVIVPFNTLSVTGGLLNVYKALELAELKSKS